MELVREFGKIGKKDVSLAGGKGASLGEMTQTGIPIPPGFVVLSHAFERFLEETDLNVEIAAALDSVDHQEMHTIDVASEIIQALINQAKMPKDISEVIFKSFIKLKVKYVAVRSSATAEDSAKAAWAGQLDTYLNVTKFQVVKNVQRCWASLFTPRAIFYRFEKKLHRKSISVAVVVQKMVQSEISGTAFSVHPVTLDRNQLIIEAGFGLGEAVVSGQITPDSYVVDKRGFKILDKNVVEQERTLVRDKTSGNIWKDLSKVKGARQTLSDKQIIELSKMLVKIEKHYRFPVDIEWAIEKNKLYVTQSRPITTL
ncbi:MAG: PEP/pyruvate-binding domain-containing protein [bacterium]